MSINNKNEGIVKKIFLYSWCSLILLPIAVNATGIKNFKGAFDTKENNEISSKIIVDITKKNGELDQKFYGTHLDAYSPFPNKTLLDELQLGKIRVGGNEFDVYNWKLKKAVNSKGEIIAAPGIEDLAQTIKNYKLDGIFQVNLTGFQPELIKGQYVIKRTFNAQSAYEMLKHFNGVLKLNIVDISLGNEFSIWNETHPKVWPSEDGITADEFIDRYIEFAISLRKAQEEISGNPNSIKLWGPEISTSWYDWNTGNFRDDCQWTDVKGQVACTYGNGKFTHFLPYFFYRLKNAEKNKILNPKSYKLLDYLALHYYPNFRTKNSDPTSVIKNEEGVQRVAEILESTRVLNDPTFINKFDISSYRNSSPNILGRMKTWVKEGYPGLKLAINEFALDSDYRSNSYHPIIRPLYLADSIGIFSNEGVSFLNQFLLSSTKSSKLPWSMIEDGERTNLFYMFKLFTNNFLGTRIEVTDNEDDTLNAYGTLQGKFINLAIVNKEPYERKIKVYVKNGSMKKLLTVTAPPWSTSIIKFQEKPSLFGENSYEASQYGAAEMGILPDLKYAKKK